MTDPDTYIKSRTDAVRIYIHKYNISIKSNPVTNSAILYKIIRPNSDITMKKADEIYQKFVKYYRHKIPVEGEPYHEWSRRVLKYITKFQRENEYLDKDMGELFGMHYSVYNRIKVVGNGRGRNLWRMLNIVLDHKRKHRPKYMSQLSYWRHQS